VQEDRDHPSKLFIPLNDVAILGGLCTLLGTGTNLVVHAFMVNARKTDPDMPLMTMFTLTPVGVPCAVVGLLFIVIASRLLLPSRKTLFGRCGRRAKMQVLPGSQVDGLTIEQAGLRHLPAASRPECKLAGRGSAPLGTITPAGRSASRWAVTSLRRQQGHWIARARRALSSLRRNFFTTTLGSATSSFAHACTGDGEYSRSADRNRQPGWQDVALIPTPDMGCPA
jgi:di/tricarboxylate transporter